MPPACKLLVFSTVYPNAAQPHHGIFVRERMRGLPPDVRVVDDPTTARDEALERGLALAAARG